MITTITVSEFRENLSKYLGILTSGQKVKLTDGRKGTTVAVLKDEPEEDFDWDSYMEFLENTDFSSIFTDNDLKMMKRRRTLDKKRIKELNW